MALIEQHDRPFVQPHRQPGELSIVARADAEQIAGRPAERQRL
jgi:hypothetical protein